MSNLYPLKASSRVFFIAQVASVINLLKNKDAIYQVRCFAKESFPYAVSGFGILKFKSFNILSRKLLEAHFVLKDLCIVSLSSSYFLV